MSQANGLAQEASTKREGKAADRVGMIPVAKIRYNPVALRDVDKESEAYLSLVDSVRKKGVLIPILVREYSDDQAPGEILYGLIDGLQRYNAALDNGLAEVAAKITDADQAEIEEMQIVANAQRIETKVHEYATALARLLQRKPTMTMDELSDRVSKPKPWLYRMLGMAKNLLPEIGKLVDEKKITASNGVELSKLKADDQLAFLDKAQTMDPGEFTATVAARLKDIREARKKGKAEGPPTFEPVAHQRKWAEIKNEYGNGCPNLLPLLKKQNITTPEEAVKMVVAWCCYMDADSQAEQRTENEAKKKEREAANEVRKLEAIKKKEAEAAQTKADLEKKIREREAQPVPA